MRATNLGFKNPHEIFHVPYLDVNDPANGAFSRCRSKDSKTPKPRAVTADRFDNQYTKNYSTNSNLSPSSYNPTYGTIASEVKRRTTFRYVEDAVGSRTPGAYTYVGQQKIFNPEVLSPTHKRLFSPVHSKSKCIDLGTGFNAKDANQINSIMLTLESKVDYEKEAIRANPPRSIRTGTPVLKTPVKPIGSHYDRMETPPTAYTASPHNSTFSTYNLQATNLNSPSNSAFHSREQSPKRANDGYSSFKFKHSHHARNRSVPDSFNLGIEESTSANALASTKNIPTLNLPEDSSKQIGSFNFSKKSEINTANDMLSLATSSTNSQGRKSRSSSKRRQSQPKFNVSDRFEKPNERIDVLSIDLKDYSRKLAKARANQAHS